MEYDFSVLNDRDFEALSLDILSSSFGTRIERFKPGKDAGVDGRWFASPGEEVVIQCKHWLQSGVDRLISHMLGAEKRKIERLAPKRYVLVTSLPLSRANKDKLANGLAPFVASASDIYGREDLHDLLVSLPLIEGRHPKLWAATATVISRLLNQGIIGRSGFAVEEIRARAKRYVETTDATRAREKLQAAKVLIVKGEPGVGKTTLAQQLLLEAAGKGFDCYVLNDISETDAIFDDALKQFFLFDDFLGGNLLEVMQGREDAKIVAFIRRVVSKPDKYFVLTSRSHILEQGKDCSEALRRARVNSREFELSVGRLSILDKARILYSHIWAGEIPEVALNAIYESERYMYVIKHRNYNPRLVEFITDADLLSGLDLSEYWMHVQRSFENPCEIWDHVFKKQLSSDVRSLCHLVAFNGRGLPENQLRGAFRRYAGQLTESDATFAQRFHDALRLATGSVLNRSVDGSGATLWLFNPSIGDYLLGALPPMGLVRPLFSAIRTASSLAYLDTLVAEGVATLDDRSSVLGSMVQSDGFVDEVEISLSVNVVARFIGGAQWGVASAAAHAIAMRTASSMPAGEMEGALGILEKCASIDGIACFSGVVENLISDAEEVMVSPVATKRLCSLAKMLDHESAKQSFAHLSRKIIDDWRDNAAQFVFDSGIISDVLSEGDVVSAEEQVFHFIVSEMESYGIEVDSTIVSEMISEADVCDIIRGNQDAVADDRYDDDYEPVPRWSPDSEIHEYFERS